MARLRIGLAQVDATVGDIEGNALLVRKWSARAAEAGVQLLAFPEMMLTGYPIEDLVYRRTFLEANREALAALAADPITGDMAIVVGYLDRDELGPRNAAALLWNGRVCSTYFKHHLPNYGVFDERRWFVPGDTLPIVRLHEADVAITICEDLWQDGGPVTAAGLSGVDLCVVINGSPYEQGKTGVRSELVKRRAREAGATFAYVNLVGGQDELVFDGDSMIVACDGAVLARAPSFAEHLMIHDVEMDPAPPEIPPGTPEPDVRVERLVLRATGLDLPSEPAGHVEGGMAAPLGTEAEVWAAVVLGTRDYVRKNGFRSVVLGLSGGIDSAVVATIAVDALGADAVHTVAMPSELSSQGSLDDAAELARRQGTQHRVIAIKPAVDAYQEMTGGLTGLAAENLQARVRGTLLMALSNAEGHLVLTTGNKSELATGFSTLYGDSAGGWAPIKDVAKTLVWSLARWRNEAAADRGETPPIPEASITKPPSAELAPGQVDQDRLPPYDLLDAILDDYVERDLGREDLIAAGHDPETVDRVLRLVDVAEFKRRQYPPGPKISPKNFGRDRRLPITNAFRDA